MEVQSAVLVDVRLSYLVLCAEPGVLGVAIMVLGRTKGVGHALKAVHDWTSKVIRGVDPEENSIRYHEHMPHQHKIEIRQKIVN